MRLQVLHVPGCPHAATLTARVTQLVAGSVPVEQREISDQAEAEAVGMLGSPSLLIDGADPFAAAAQRPSLSCRLYYDEDGSRAGAPSLSQLRAALTTAGIRCA